MTLQEIDCNGVFAWSHVPQLPNYLAVGTAAGCIDEDFESSARLELFKLDFTNEMRAVKVGMTTTPDRFASLAWSSQNLLACGLETGELRLFNAENIISGVVEEPAVVKTHKQSAKSLDFSILRPNMLISGGDDDKVFIHDVEKGLGEIQSHIPGQPSQVLSHLCCVQWNKKVDRIAASLCHSGLCLLWDVRKKAAILSFTDPMNRRASSFAWSPARGTILAIATDDPENPAIRLYDLKNTKTPVKTLKGHASGILGMSWCNQDNRLLLSCGRDNRTICWDTTTGERVCEMPAGSNLSVGWSPGMTAVAAASSFDAKISLHSLHDAAFVKDERSADVPREDVLRAYNKAPAWFNKTSSTYFARGGKLVSSSYVGKGKKNTVTISHVVSEPHIVERAKTFEKDFVPQTGQDICFLKADQTQDETDKCSWEIMNFLLEEDSRKELIRYLGAEPAESEEATETEESSAETGEQQKAELDGGASSPMVVAEKTIEEEIYDDEALFDNLGEEPKEEEPEPEPAVEAEPEPEVPEAVPQEPEVSVAEPDSNIVAALLTSRFGDAVDFYLSKGQLAEALYVASIAGSPHLRKKTEKAFFKSQSKGTSLLLSAIATGDVRDYVDKADCKDWTKTLVMIATYTENELFGECCSILGHRLEAECPDEVRGLLLCYLCAGDVRRVVDIWGKLDGAAGLSPGESLQNTVEKLFVFAQVSEEKSADSKFVLDNKFQQYCDILAAQGELELANRFAELSGLPKAYYTEESAQQAQDLDAPFEPQQPAPMQATLQQQQQQQQPFMPQQHQHQQQPQQPASQYMQPMPYQPEPANGADVAPRYSGLPTSPPTTAATQQLSHLPGPDMQQQQQHQQHQQYEQPQQQPQMAPPPPQMGQQPQPGLYGSAAAGAYAAPQQPQQQGGFQPFVPPAPQAQAQQYQPPQQFVPRSPVEAQQAQQPMSFGAPQQSTVQQFVPSPPVAAQPQPETQPPPVATPKPAPPKAKIDLTKTPREIFESLNLTGVNRDVQDIAAGLQGLVQRLWAPDLSPLEKRKTLDIALRLTQLVEILSEGGSSAITVIRQYKLVLEKADFVSARHVVQQISHEHWGELQQQIPGLRRLAEELAKRFEKRQQAPMPQQGPPPMQMQQQQQQQLRGPSGYPVPPPSSQPK